MSPRDLPHVEVTGDAEREVVPDEIVVTVEIRTPTLPRPTDALAEGIARRGRVRPLLEGLDGVTLADARVTTAPVHREVKESDPYGGTTTRMEVLGHRGECTLQARAAAGLATVIVATAGSLPDVFRVIPRFEVSRSLSRATTRELEQEAVRDGLARAAALAEAGGVRSGAVLRIGEPGSRGYDDGQVLYSRAYSDASMGIDPDDIGELVPEPVTLSARVVVTVALEPAG